MKSKNVPEGTVFSREAGRKHGDWLELYESAFPADERQPTADMLDDLDSGILVLHTSRDSDGKLLAYSTISVNEGRTQAVNLDFIAVPGADRNRGLGTRHFQQVVEWVEKTFPDHVAVTIEMERRELDGLTEGETEQRDARARFYTRLGASQQPVDYNMLNFTDPEDRIPAEFWAYVLRPADYVLADVVFDFYTGRAGYGRQPDDPAVVELMSQFHS